MKFPCTISRQENGRWTVRHESEDLGLVRATDDTREAAISKIKDELRYRLELCPCSGQSYQFVDVEIVDQIAPPGE